MSFQEALRPLLQKAWDDHYVNTRTCLRCQRELPADQVYDDGICRSCTEELKEELE